MVERISADQLRSVLTGAREVFSKAAAGPLDSTIKNDGTIVTRVDTAVNEWLRPALFKLMPEAAWLSEETVDDPARRDAEFTWIVDPLDGTKELARGVPECAISIGLVRDGAVCEGAVLNPFDGLGAAVGCDARLFTWQDARDRASPARSPTVTSISRSETEDGTIAPFLDLFAPVQSIGSVANKLLRVACGFEKLTVSVQPKSEWDLCGGVALLEARGFVLTRLDGNALQFNQCSTRIPGGFVAGPPMEVAFAVEAVNERRTFAQRCGDRL